MILTVVNIIFVLLAVSMIALILLQRGAGAAAGSGFGAGASATVFGARGAGNFLTRATAVLATCFLLISLGMAMYVARSERAVRPVDDLGVMRSREAAEQGTVPAQRLDDVPQAPADAPLPAEQDTVPSAPVEPQDEDDATR